MSSEKKIDKQPQKTGEKPMVKQKRETREGERDKRDII